jgi:beta-xylosidase
MRMPRYADLIRTMGLCLLLLLAAVGCDAQTGQPIAATATGAPTAGTSTAAAPTGTLPASQTSTAGLAQTTQTSQPQGTGTTTVTTGTVPAGAGTFQNPVLTIDFPDPHVLKVGDMYYAYATNASGRNVQLARSKDLVKWEFLTDAMPALPTWAKLGGSFVWAPEVIEIGGKFFLYYTARDKASDKQCVGVAVADKPEGKFRDSNPAPLVCQAEEGGTIDAHPFRDGDKLYLYYKNDGNCCNMPTYLYVQEMAPDGLSLLGEPVRLVRNDAAWEDRVVEAPTMWKHNGQYYLFYSGNNYAGIEYAVGYATCQTPMGPCEDAPENPILASRMNEKPIVVGPGHQTIIEDDDGETWIVYHVWEVTSAGLRGTRRFMWIDRLVWNEGKPDITGPNTNAQPLP